MYDVDVLADNMRERFHRPLLRGTVGIRPIIDCSAMKGAAAAACWPCKPSVGKARGRARRLSGTAVAPWRWQKEAVDDHAFTYM